MQNQKELIKIGSILLGSFDKKILDEEFPDFLNYLKEIPQDLINEVVTEEQLKIDLSGSVTITKDQFITLYCHSSAILGSEEFSRREPGIRLLLLNSLTPDELNAVMMKIEQIKKNYVGF